MRPLNLFGEVTWVFDKHVFCIFIENQTVFVETK